MAPVRPEIVPEQQIGISPDRVRRRSCPITRQEIKDLMPVTSMPVSQTTTAAVRDQPKLLCFGEAVLHRLDGSQGGSARDADAGAEERPGGNPVTVACAAARLGTPTAFLGRLGDDAGGRRFRDLFRERGVATMALQVDGDHPTRVAASRLDGAGLPRTDAPEIRPEDGFADEAVRPETLAEAAMPLLRDARWLLLSAGLLTSPSSAVALDLLLHRATARGVAIALDLQWRPTFWGLAPGEPPTREVVRRCRPLLEAASLIRATPGEADWFLGSRDPAAIHAALPKRPAVLLLDDSGAVSWCLGGRSGSQPAADAVAGSDAAGDRAGAADAFMAGLLDGLCRDPELLGGVAAGPGAIPPAGDIADLLRFATACSTLVSRGRGAIEPQPSRTQVFRHLQP
jgi:fructokinase